jgi:FtsH-binding integral membrane protein
LTVVATLQPTSSPTGVVLIFVRIPAAYTIYSIFGLLVFSLYTVLNIFLFFLQLFGRSR